MYAPTNYRGASAVIPYSWMNNVFHTVYIRVEQYAPPLEGMGGHTILLNVHPNNHW